jgi:nucleotide-binding universal stress UspA family protein
MAFRPSVLCPVDFSEDARGALRYAAALAAHFQTPLTLLAVNDPLLEEAAALSAGPTHLTEDTRRELERFFSHTFERPPKPPADVRLEVVTGKPAAEILRVSRERGCDLLVMGSHGSTGFRKLFFGSTTERVLRETTVPVLVTPGSDSGPLQLHDIPHAVRRVLAPVDLSPASAHQLATTARIAEALQVPWLVLHVIEPVRSMVASTLGLPNMEAERRDRAERQLEATLAFLAPARPEMLIAYGEPAEEVAKVAADRNAGLIVMGLHSSPLLGPRMGSVTYRVLCLAHRLVLALPPRAG